MEPVNPDWAVITRSARSTQSLARRLGTLLEPPTVVAFDGEMGAGKTTFIRGLAEGLQIHNLREVVSPTYSLMHVYPGERWPLVHMDLYRLDDPESARALGLEEQMYRSDAIVAVEWAERMPDLLPPGHARIHLRSDGASRRVIAVWGLKRPKGLRLPAP